MWKWGPHRLSGGSIIAPHKLALTVSESDEFSRGSSVLRQQPPPVKSVGSEKAIL